MAAGRSCPRLAVCTLTDLALLTMDDVCELLQVKKSWLYRQVEAREIPALKLGNQLRFKRQAIEDYLERVQIAAE